MFYSQVILARKGPLGKIWIAAHYDKKLTKAQIFSTDIAETVQSVLNPAAPLALRVSGHLMLGIVRIFSRKVKYLMADCTEAMWKMKLDFRPGVVDLPENQAYSTSNVDDLKYFGNVSLDQEFPNLSDVSYPRYLLEDRTIATTDDFINKDKKYSDLDDDWSKPVSSTARISDIEIARRESLRQSQSFVRSTMSSATKRSGSLLTKLEDEDIPAFDDQEDFLPPVMEDIFENPTFELGAVPQLDIDIQFDEERVKPKSDVDIAMSKEDLSIDQIIEPRKKRKLKKTLPHFDERVELSSKFIKGLMSDRSTLLRRLPNDALEPFKFSKLKPLGFCNQLESTFNLPLTFGEFPFNKKAIDNEPLSEEKLQLISDNFETARGVSISPIDNFPVDFANEMPEQLQTASPEIMSPFKETEVPLSHAENVSQFTEQAQVDLDFEKFGEDHWTTRTKQVYAIISNKLKLQDSVDFDSLSQSLSRRTAAISFFEILQLKSWNTLELYQKEPYENIYISLTNN